MEPTLNKRIHTLIDADNNYIVYLDDQFYVEYSLTDAYGESPEGFGDVANKIAHMENLSMIYITPSQLEAFRRILGEAMARIIGDKDEAKAKESLEIAESFLTARSLERARIWYLQASVAATGMAIVLAAGLWLFRERITVCVGLNTFEVCVAALMGAVGSFMSIWIHPGRIRMDAGAGKSIHRWEGSARIVIGVFCAFAVALGVKADIILGFVQSSEHSLAYMLVVCVAAGFSERLFLNLIGHFQDRTLGDGGEKTRA